MSKLAQPTSQRSTDGGLGVRKTAIAALAVISVLAAMPSLAQNQPAQGAKSMEPETSELVGALNRVFGKHEGKRASHAKGISVIGEFQAAPGNPVSGVEMFSPGAKATVTGRLSIGGGNPKQTDISRTVRGFGLEIADGKSTWTLVLISAPTFFARDAKQFVDFMTARVPDPKVGGPNPEAVAAFNAANPNTMPHQLYLRTTAPTADYAREHFHSGHAYGLRMNGNVVQARIELRPVEGRLGISVDEEKTLAPDFLGTRLNERFQAGKPAEWDLIARIAAPTDDIRDVTAAWEGPRTEIVLGRVTISGLDPKTERAGRVFDPIDLPKGVEEPKDPIFLLRSPAYAISATNR